MKTVEVDPRLAGDKSHDSIILSVDGDCLLQKNNPLVPPSRLLVEEKQ